MQERFSWPAFAVAHDRLAGWVDQGRPRPKHSEFSAYVAFCIERSGARLVYGKVDKLAIASGRWEVTYIDRNVGSRQIVRGFDGVVITGAGPARSSITKVADPRIHDGVTFWQALDGSAAKAQSATEPVVIIASGGDLDLAER